MGHKISLAVGHSIVRAAFAHRNLRECHNTGLDPQKAGGPFGNSLPRLRKTKEKGATFCLVVDSKGKAPPQERNQRHKKATLCLAVDSKEVPQLAGVTGFPRLRFTRGFRVTQPLLQVQISAIEVRVQTLQKGAQRSKQAIMPLVEFERVLLEGTPL